MWDFFLSSFPRLFLSETIDGIDRPFKIKYFITVSGYSITKKTTYVCKQTKIPDLD